MKQSPINMLAALDLFIEGVEKASFDFPYMTALTSLDEGTIRSVMSRVTSLMA